MEKYTEYITGTPRPLVFVSGQIDNEPDFHTKLLKVLDTMHLDYSSSDSNVLLFKSVPPDFAVHEKKPAKEFLSVEGIIKHNFHQKHYQAIPSLVILCFPFGVDWSAGDWTKREFRMQDHYTRLKASLSGRDIRVVILMVKIGAGSMDKDVLDDRISTFKRHAQSDSKSFVFVGLGDITPDNNTIKRLYKTVRDSSFAYYTANIKRFKVIEKSLSDRYKGHMEALLTARYDVKIAYLNEFLGQMNYSLKYYRQAYHHLIRAMEGSVDEEIYDQLKAVAEICHVKILRYLLLLKSTEEAFQQFRQHILVFSKLYCLVPYSHCQWLAEQYLVMVTLLDRHQVSETLPYGDRAFYYQNAARFALERGQLFNRYLKTNPEPITPVEGVTAFKYPLEFEGKMILPPKFVGSAPIVSGVGSVEEANQIYLKHLATLEVTIDHRNLALGYLNKALSALSTEARRRRAMVLHLIATEEMNIPGHLSQALELLWHGVEMLSLENWHYAAMPLLQNIQSCAIGLGRAGDYVSAGLALYTNTAFVYYSRHDLEELHLNLMAIFHASLQANEAENDSEGRSIQNETTGDQNFEVSLDSSPYVQNLSVFITSSFVPSIHTVEFGAKSPADELELVNKVLPDGHVMNVDHACRLFDVKIDFMSEKDKKSNPHPYIEVELGQVLTLKFTIQSNFLDKLIFDEMVLYSFDDTVIRKFTHNAIASVAENDERDLTLLPFHATLFTCAWEINETLFSRFLAKDSIFGIDRIELIWKQKQSLIFSINALPCDLQEYKLKQKMWNTKDLFFFTKDTKQTSIVRILRPGNLLSIIYPYFGEKLAKSTQISSKFLQPEKLSDVNLLRGLLQRVDVVLEVGTVCDLQDMKIYISSDFIIYNTNEECVFYLPNLRHIDIVNDEKNRENELDKVEFSPMTLNASQQPAHPLLFNPHNTAGGGIPMKSKVFLPLFLRFSRIGSFTVSLKVEFIGMKIMNQTTSMDFELPINVSEALEVKSRVDSSSNVLMVSTVCLADFAPQLLPLPPPTATTATANKKMSVSTSSSAVVIKKVDFSSSALIAITAMVAENETKCEDGTVVLLHQHEEYRSSYSITSSTHSPNTSQQGQQEKGAMIEVQWMAEDNHHHPLHRPRILDLYDHFAVSDCGYFPSTTVEGSREGGRHEFDWIVSAVPPTTQSAAAAQAAAKEEEVGEDEKVVNDKITITSIAHSYFPLPSFATTTTNNHQNKSNDFFNVSLIHPSSITMGEEFTLTLIITKKAHSGSSCYEKLSLVVLLSEFLLLLGSTNTVLEVYKEEVVSIRAIALRPGWVSLPRIQLQWERGAAGNAKVYDNGEREQDRRTIFVLPATN